MQSLPGMYAPQALLLYSLPFPLVSNGLPMGLCDVLFGIENSKPRSPDVVVDSTPKVAE